MRTTEPVHAGDSNMVRFRHDVVVVGGCGHVGLPLALAFAGRGLDVLIYDTDRHAVDLVNSGVMPFDEPGAADVLRAVIGGHLTASVDPAVVAAAEHVILVVGTPIGEHLDPDPQAVPDAVDNLVPYLRDGQLIVLRSTHYPGVTALVERRMASAAPGVEITFCPERIAEGRAMTELFDLPQIVSGRSDGAMDRAEKLFRVLTSETVRLQPEEAELAKLFTNSYRYLKFAIANQLFKIANDFGVDYERIRRALTYDYPRAADLPRAGFAAGPCLLKDTMQLAAFNNNDFVLGHASMMVNEGLPLYVVDRMARHFDLAPMTVGILGMAFKAESDDIRSSLSYKLKRILRFRAATVLTTDPYVTRDADLLPLAEVLERSDILVIGTPHNAYAGLRTDRPVVDIWDVCGRGVQI
jgi:UDP-N-acetyl-D-mannosaminuronic acid dehydrogenase